MAALYLALKDLRILLRDRVAVFWVFGFPLAFALFTGAVVHAGLSGETAPVKLVVIDESLGPEAASLRQRLATSTRIETRLAGVEEAERLVRQARAIAYLKLPEGFGSPGTALPELGIDPARKLELAYLEQFLAQSLEQGRTQAALGDELRFQRIEVTGPLSPSASNIVFPSAVLWALIGCAACFAISLVAERTGGTYVRLRASPLTRQDLLAGKALSCLLASLSVATLLTVLGTVFFGVQISSVLKLALALIATSLCFVGITMGLSVLGKSEQAVAGAGWATLLVMAMLGGAMVPLSLMPEWLVELSHISPVKWGILALEGASWRAFSLKELALPCAVLLGVGLASFLAGVLVMRQQRV